MQYLQWIPTTYSTVQYSASTLVCVLVLLGLVLVILVALILEYSSTSSTTYSTVQHNAGTYVRLSGRESAQSHEGLHNTSLSQSWLRSTLMLYFQLGYCNYIKHIQSSQTSTTLSKCDRFALTQMNIFKKNTFLKLMVKSANADDDDDCVWNW